MTASAIVHPKPGSKVAFPRKACLRFVLKIMDLRTSSSER
jgi:hypothetical protein